MPTILHDVFHLLIALQGVQLPPAPRGYGTSTAEVVVDAASVLPASSVDRIDRIAFDVHQKSGGEMAVVTLPDIGLRAPADVSLAIGRAWGVGSNAAIGQQSRNAGVVILVVPKETSSTGQGACFISTGQGTEGFITDADAASYCREAIPYFRQQDYGTAMELLAARVGAEFAREFGFTLDSSSAAPVVQRAPPRGQREISPIAFFAILIVVYVVLASLGRGRRGCGGCIPVPIIFPTGGGYRRGGWGGGGWGGGFGGGGGGGFGGFGGGGGFSGGGGGSNW